MKDGLKMVAAAVGVLVVLLALGWIFTGNEFFLYKFFAPKTEAVRRTVFEQSKAYRQGMVMELQNMQYEYLQAKPEQQAALASIILHRAADVDETTMPFELRSFISNLRSERSK